MATERHIDSRTIRLVQGDITLVPADAIVNAANSALASGSGVNGAINRAGGPAIMAELRARYRGCPTGSAVVSASGKLEARIGARWVIHAVGPIWHGGGERERELLESAYRRALELADELGARVVSFPALSAGVYGYPLAEAAEVAIQTVGGQLSAVRTVETVQFVLFGPQSLEAFEAALGRIAAS